MNSFPKRPADSAFPPLNSVPLGWLVSATTLPILLALVGGKALAGAVQNLGHLSEEVFRGDRLPLLKFPVESNRVPESARED